ncbi:MAG: hypothetical protein ACLFV7_11985 [Phycisphaerae bacterium]
MPGNTSVPTAVGDAEVTEPDGATTSDKVLMVTLRAEGRLFAEGRFSQRKLKDFPLYTRALKARQYVRRNPPKRTREAPELVIVARSQEKGEGVRTDVTKTPPRETEAEKEDDRTGRTPPPDKDDEIPGPPRYEPVVFRADNLLMRPGDPNKGISRIIVARGDVYLSQGNPDSELFLELRSQGAVVFTGPARKKDGSPLAPKISGMEGGDPNQPRETILGVYLDEDVVISRGERKLRGPVAYYDFTTDRAIVLDAVMRTIQEQRNIPVYVRAEEARVLSAREMWFRNAKVSTSDFHTPTYHIGAKEAYAMDQTPYDEDGEPLGQRRWLGKFKHTTFNVRSVPILYWPKASSDFEQDHTALRKATFGSDSKRGFGVETEWHLFRMLGLVKPEGYDAEFHFDWYERGGFAGIDSEYRRENYSGYARLYGMLDEEAEDDFGETRQDIAAQRLRGRLLWRHKQQLADDWLLQAETSYYCDRNYIESFFRNEFYAGKEQENLLYARKQKDNWAITGLLAAQLNRFEPAAEAAPAVSFYLLGEPLLENMLTYFHESHLGLRRYRYESRRSTRRNPHLSDSRFMARADTRQEINYPVTLFDGKVNALAYATGRLTHWGDTMDGGQACRAFGQVGLKANMNFWKVYEGVHNRLFDIDRLRHIVTPTVLAFAGAQNIDPDRLYPITPGIEQHIRENEAGVAFGIRQRLQTKRGPAGDQRTVDWMRLNVMAGFFDNGQDLQPAHGQAFFSRPEYSLGRNFINGEYQWNISDSTALLADVNYDVDSGKVKVANAGLVLRRAPRLRTYLGWRYMSDLDTSVGTIGLRYQINEKYSLSVFEQYDFDFRSRRNLKTVVTIVRKWPRWYSSLSFTYGQVDEGETLALALTFWPEGIDEVRIRTGRLSVVDSSDDN